jgi:hypothetical protein
VCNHSSVVFEDRMFMFGGSNQSHENANTYVLDLEKNSWSIIKPKGFLNDSKNIPFTRDEHSSVVYNDSMFIFGGFTFGDRTN